MPLNIQRPIQDLKAIVRRGALGKENYYTPERTARLVARFGEEKAAELIARYEAQKGIYQRYHYRGKRYIVKWNFYPYVIVHTEASDATRSKFRDGMNAWKALTDEQKKEIHKKKRGRRMTDCNFFLHKFMLDSI